MKKDTVILGLSFFYHDSAAALVVNGRVIAAVQEERFTGKKNDSAFPIHSITFCLHDNGYSIKDLSCIVFYEKPLSKLSRLLTMYIDTWPYGLLSFLQAALAWIKTKLWVEYCIRKKLNFSGDIFFTEHHYAHAAGAYYCSDFSDAAIVTIDGVGEYDTTTVGHARNNTITLTEHIVFPDSLGLVYSAFTAYLGFRVHCDEYKIMGLAPYGNPSSYRETFSHLITLAEDGSFKINMRYFSYNRGLAMTSPALHRLFKGKPLPLGTCPSQREMDIAASLQNTLEEVVLRIIRHAKEISGSENLCFSGGVALNCALNQKIMGSGLFKRMYVHPAPGDAGGAVGAALYVYYETFQNQKKDNVMLDTFLGPSYSQEEIVNTIRKYARSDIFYEQLYTEELYRVVAHMLDEGAVVGWFQGSMEYGPRALGNRSILADPRKKAHWRTINEKVKFREIFRPLAPAAMEEYAMEYFDVQVPVPYMTHTVRVLSKALPAVTHVDGTARLQTVSKKNNEKFYKLLNAFYMRTGCPVLINTSLNVRGAPIALGPEDALRCFTESAMDCLIIGNWVLRKNIKIGEHEI